MAIQFFNLRDSLNSEIPVAHGIRMHTNDNEWKN